MHVSPQERDKLLIHRPGAGGYRGGRTVGELISSGREVLARDKVLDGGDVMIDSVQVEATFPDGTAALIEQACQMLRWHHAMRVR